MNQKELKIITNFLFEAGVLKRQKDRGPTLAGLNEEDATSLAGHTMRSCIIAYFLAQMENTDPQKSVTLCLFHDIHETRTTDLHKVAAKYIKTQEAEKKALLDQTKALPDKIKKDIRKIWQESEGRKTPEAIVAKDADWLEQALSAREYISFGYMGMQDWINNVRTALETDSAKNLLKVIEKSDLNEWYQGIKKMTYKKLKKKKVKKK